MASFGQLPRRLGEEFQERPQTAVETGRLELTRRWLVMLQEGSTSLAGPYSQARVRAVWESQAPADGIVDTRITETTTYDHSGNVLAHVMDIDTDGPDGIPEQRQTETSTYNAHGNLVHQMRGVDDPVDGTVDWGDLTTRVYDQANRLTQNTYEFFALVGGVYNRRFTHTLDYGHKENPTQEVFEEDTSADGVIDSRERWDNDYDARGNLVRQERDFQQFENGSVIFRIQATVINQFDQRGEFLQQVYDIDWLADGTIDVREVFRSVHGPDDSFLGWVLEWDYGADGTIEYRSVYSQTTDQRGNPVSIILENTDDSGTSRFIQESEYDQRGFLVRQEIENVDRNGHRDLLTATLEYDARGRLVQKVEESDGVGAAEPDGVIETRITTTNEYDAHGNLARQRIDEDELDTAEIDYRDTGTFQYTGSQRPLRVGGPISAPPGAGIGAGPGAPIGPAP